MGGAKFYLRLPMTKEAGFTPERSVAVSNGRQPLSAGNYPHNHPSTTNYVVMAFVDQVLSSASAGASPLLQTRPVSLGYTTNTGSERSRVASKCIRVTNSRRAASRTDEC